MPLRTVFMGTPEFAVRPLAAILDDSPHEVVAAYTQPPRPAGRGKRPKKSAVHALAEKRGIPVRTPESLKDAAVQTAFAGLGADAAVVAAYGLILPKPILDAPRLGCINVHASLLPRWRGAAPIQRAILAGDHETGITIMRMDEGLDTGPILASEAISMGAMPTNAELHDRLAVLGACMIVWVLNGLEAGVIEAAPQPAQGVTYAPRLTREEGRLDWRDTAAALERRVRAFAPWPGAWFEADDTRIKVLDALPIAEAAGADPGTVLDDRLTVACGRRCLRLLRVQRAGRAPQDAPAFLRGFPISKGTRLPVPDGPPPGGEGAAA